MECHKPSRCLKETDVGNGFFLGTPFVYEDCWMACHFCKEELEHQEKEKNDGHSTESVNGEGKSL